MPKGDNDTRPDANLIEGVGAADSNSGGGAGAGVPDADTGMNAPDAVRRGDPAEDRRKIFPDAPGGDPRSMAKQRATTGGDPTEQDRQRRGDVSDEETE